MSRTPPPEETASYRSPPIRAEAAAETYRTAMSTGGIARRHRAQQDLLRGVSDRLEVRELAFPPPTARAGDDAGCGYPGDDAQGMVAPHYRQRA